jgi:SHS2 domain-containing protein
LTISNLGSRIFNPMPYRYLEELAIADEAFEAWGNTVEEMFYSASDALLNIMVNDLDTVEPREGRQFGVEAGEIDMLLFQMLQEFVYYKDADGLLLRAKSFQIVQQEDGWNALVEACGELIDPERHDLIVDIKAVTLYRLKVEQTRRGWVATVVVDV